MRPKWLAARCRLRRRLIHPADEPGRPIALSRPASHPGSTTGPRASRTASKPGGDIPPWLASRRWRGGLLPAAERPEPGVAAPHSGGEVVEAVVGAATVDQVGGPPQVPAVGLGHE